MQGLITKATHQGALRADEHAPIAARSQLGGIPPQASKPQPGFRAGWLRRWLVVWGKEAEMGQDW